MSVVATPIPPPPAPGYHSLRRFSIDEYHRMIQADILNEEDRVELLEGWIVVKMPRNPPHDSTLDISVDVLHGRLPQGWRIRSQLAITTSDSEPEPDLAVVISPASRYADHHPGPQEIAVVIEVSDSSLLRDRQDKGRLYARAAIVCYWIINLVDRQVEVYTDPTGPDVNPSYRQRQDYGLGDTVPLVIAGQEVARIAVQEFFP